MKVIGILVIAGLIGFGEISFATSVAGPPGVAYEKWLVKAKGIYIVLAGPEFKDEEIQKKLLKEAREKFEKQSPFGSVSGRFRPVTVVETLKGPTKSGVFNCISYPFPLRDSNSKDASRYFLVAVSKKEIFEKSVCLGKPLISYIPTALKNAVKHGLKLHRTPTEKDFEKWKTIIFPKK